MIDFNINANNINGLCLSVNLLYDDYDVSQRFLTCGPQPPGGPRYLCPGSAAALIRRNSYSKKLIRESKVSKNLSSVVRDLQKVKNHCTKSSATSLSTSIQ